MFKRLFSSSKRIEPQSDPANNTEQKPGEYLLNEAMGAAQRKAEEHQQKIEKAQEELLQHERDEAGANELYQHYCEQLAWQFEAIINDFNSKYPYGQIE